MINMKQRLRSFHIAFCFCLLTFCAWSPNASAEESRPNIVWIVIEDMSPHFGCYGETTIETPHINQLAAEGVKFQNAFVTAPVCSTSRSAMITGMYQTTIGAHHHRSGRGTEKIHLPGYVQLIPELFQQAGYFTCNRNELSSKTRPGKTDYNFEFDQQELYSGTDWSERDSGQPFFAQIQLHGGKLRSGKNFRENVEKTLGEVTKPQEVTLPPYYPNHPVILQDWADYLDTVRMADHEVGLIIDRLQKEEIYENTCIFLITDHGISHVRGKQFCYEEGMRIPLIVRGPGINNNETRDDLALQIDLAASSLGMAGIQVPEYLQAVDLFAEDYLPRDFAVSARDRCDETVDRIRAVRTDRFKYIRNFYDLRPYLQPCAYKDNKEIMQAMREAYQNKELNEDQSLIMAEVRPPEELYDLQADPFELNNLALDPKFSGELAELRGSLFGWIQASRDQGQTPEPEAMYDSDMQVYLQTIQKRQPERAEEIARNIALMKKWAAAGK